MSDDKPKVHPIVDLRAAPLSMLSLVLGAVVSYSVISNFGLGFLPVDKLPATAQKVELGSGEVKKIAITKAPVKKPEPVKEPAETAVAASGQVSTSPDEPAREAETIDDAPAPSVAEKTDRTPAEQIATDTSRIVAKANLVAGAPAPREEAPEAVEGFNEPGVDAEEVSKNSSPEDLPILRVIIPETGETGITSAAPEPLPNLDGNGEVTLSRAMTDAVDSGAVDRVFRLIEEGQPINGQDRAGQTLLLKAAWNGDEEMFDALLAAGANIHIVSNDGRSPLFSATVSGNISLVRKLLDKGAQIDTTTLEGKTPLMVSAWSNYPDIAELLLRRGADPDLVDNNGRNALFYALWDRNIDVVRTLIQYGADMEQVDKQGHSAVDIARLRRIELPGMRLEPLIEQIN